MLAFFIIISIVFCALVLIGSIVMVQMDLEMNKVGDDTLTAVLAVVGSFIIIATLTAASITLFTQNREIHSYKTQIEHLEAKEAK